MNNYPYPVLTENNSSYKSNFYYKLKFVEHKMEQSFLKIYLKIDFNAPYIESLIKQNKAKIIIKYTTEYFSDVREIFATTEEIIVKIPSEKLLAIDNIKIDSSIISTEQFILSKTNDLLPIYPDDYSYSIRKHMVLALAKQISLSYNLNNSDFIRIAEGMDRDGKGLMFKCDKPEYIYVMVGHEFNQAYATNKQDINVRNLTNNIIVFNAILYAMMQIIKNGITAYESYDWYKILNQSFDYNSETLEDFVNSMRNEDGYITNLRTEELFECCQLLMNNAIERTVIKISEGRS